MTLEPANFPSRTQNKIKMVSGGRQCNCKFVSENPQEPLRDSMATNASPPGTIRVLFRSLQWHLWAFKNPPFPLGKQCFSGFQGSLNRNGFLLLASNNPVYMPTSQTLPPLPDLLLCFPQPELSTVASITNHEMFFGASCL